jgi:UDP-N-acetylglucosamine 1-carboxyvinyltransferase
MLAMDALEVHGGARLVGEVRITGAKNSVLKLMAAALLAEGETVLTEVPDILDVHIMAELLRRLGCTVDVAIGSVRIVVPEQLEHRADYDLVRKMRASICVLGPLLARCAAADVAVPGGDNIGSRGLDMHIAGLIRMGAEVRNEHGYLRAKRAHRLTGAHVWLDFPSVGATETLVMAAVTADGEMIIENAAREPEIVDICQMLTAMGADIQGIGTSTLTINGVVELHPVQHRTVVRIASSRARGRLRLQSPSGRITIRNAFPAHLEFALDKVVHGRGRDQRRERLDSFCGTDGISASELVDIVTLPYPGFPTDLQPQFIALNCYCGRSSPRNREPV